MRLDKNIYLFPLLHGRASYALELRALCLHEKFDCIAIDIPDFFEPYLPDAVSRLPEISAMVAGDNDDCFCYLPIDPCDASIEAVRQSFQLHIPFKAIGYPSCKQELPLPYMPDDHAVSHIGIDAYNLLALSLAARRTPENDHDDRGGYLAGRLTELGKTHRSILAVVHVRHVESVKRCYGKPYCPAYHHDLPPHRITSALVNPDHLYFALGELPYMTGIYERERYDLLSTSFDPLLSIKNLFRETRDMVDNGQPKLSPVRIQAALTFLRNLTVRESRLFPSLFDMVEAAKGVGGNRFALEILKQAKYYPWLPIDKTNGMISIGIDKIRIPEWNLTTFAVNLFRDQAMMWQRVSLKPDPSELQKTKYRYQWNPYGMCSHTPEDTSIERFNGCIRKKALSVLVEDRTHVEKFVSSVKDGIDIRETLRNWHEKSIYVKELPPSKANIDTVIIIFDADNDARYPHRTTWYAEHPDESTLSFYATEPFCNLIGPGIARCTYGGIALLFPPRPIPDIFSIQAPYELPDLRAHITYGALVNSKEPVVAYAAYRKPDSLLVNLAKHCGKRLLWVPLASFSQETLRRLRTFHILNGKTVRSWATRFIGDE